jgi:hypothetical protein
VCVSCLSTIEAVRVVGVRDRFRTEGESVVDVLLVRVVVPYRVVLSNRLIEKCNNNDISELHEVNPQTCLVPNLSAYKTHW